MYFNTKKELDNFIQSFNKDLKLKKGSGYYYWYSDNEKLSEMLCSLENSSVFVDKQNQLTKKQWEEEIEDILFKSYSTKFHK